LLKAPHPFETVIGVLIIFNVLIFKLPPKLKIPFMRVLSKPCY